MSERRDCTHPHWMLTNLAAQPGNGSTRSEPAFSEPAALAERCPADRKCCMSEWPYRGPRHFTMTLATRSVRVFPQIKAWFYEATQILCHLLMQTRPPTVAHSEDPRDGPDGSEVCTCLLQPQANSQSYRELTKLKDEIRERVPTPARGHTQLMPALLSASPEPLSILSTVLGSVSAEIQDCGAKNPKALSPSTRVQPQLHQGISPDPLCILPLRPPLATNGRKLAFATRSSFLMAGGRRSIHV